MDEKTPTFWDAPETADVIALKRVSELQQQQHNLRRGLFLRHEMMKQEVKQLRDEIATLRMELFPNRFTKEFTKEFTKGFTESFLEQAS